MAHIIGRYNVAYEFTLAEIDRIEDATNELHAMCMDFVADEVKQGDYAHYRFTDLQKNLIEQTWAKNVPHLYGRFDFGYDGENLKMFEYNADTPTSLLEAAVVQWQWLEQNWRLIASWSIQLDSRRIA